MKKLFTILAATMLFAGSMMAQTTLVKWDGTESKRVGSFACGSEKVSFSTVKIHANTDQVPAVKFESTIQFTEGNTHYLVVKPTTGGFKAGNVVDLALCFSNSSDSKVAKIAVYAANKETRLYLSDPGINGRTSPADPDIVSFTLEADQDSLFLGREDAGTTTYLTTLHIYEPAPADAPVSEVTITGASNIVVGQKVTLTAKTDVAATQIEWQDENEQTLGFGDTFDFTPDEEGTFTFYALAENAYNASPVKSTAFDVTVGPAPCTELYPAASGENPTVGSVIDLATGSYGGKITVTGLKEAGSIKYNAAGLQFGGGSVDSVLVTLDNYLAVGSIIELTMRAGGKSGTRGLNILANNEKVFEATWEVADANDIRTIQYTVTSEDGLAGLYKFGLQRSNSIYLKSIKIYHCGAEVPEQPTAVENAEAAVKAVKVVENGQLVIIKNGVKYNAQGAIVK